MFAQNRFRTCVYLTMKQHIKRNNIPSLTLKGEKKVRKNKFYSYDIIIIAKKVKNKIKIKEFVSLLQHQRGYVCLNVMLLGYSSNLINSLYKSK